MASDLLVEGRVDIFDDCGRHVGFVIYRNVFKKGTGRWLRRLPPIVHAPESWKCDKGELINGPETREMQGDLEAVCEEECKRATIILGELNEGARCAREGMELVLELEKAAVTLVIPGPFDEAALAGMSLAFASKIKTVRKIERICDDHLKPSDLAGTKAELAGERFLKESGEAWDHIHENVDAQNGLRKIIERLKKALSRDDLCETDREHLEEILSKASNTLDRAKKPYRE